MASALSANCATSHLVYPLPHWPENGRFISSMVYSGIHSLRPLLSAKHMGTRRRTRYLCTPDLKLRHSWRSCSAAQNFKVSHYRKGAWAVIICRAEIGSSGWKPDMPAGTSYSNGSNGRRTGQGEQNKGFQFFATNFAKSSTENKF